MTDDWKLKDNDVIMLLLPTEDGKYIVAKSVVKDEPIETLKDAIIELPEQDGEKPNLKYPVVLVRDIDKIKDKLIEDFYQFEKEIASDLGGFGCANWFDKMRNIINKRFNYE